MSCDPEGFKRWGRLGQGWTVKLQSRRADRRWIRPGFFELEERRLLATFTVTNTADGNVPGTLRTAIANADLATGPSTIEFDPTIFGTPQTITLAGSQLELTNTSASVTITSPPAEVTISGAGKSRVFQVDNGVTASISGVTVTNGSPTRDGGGVLNYGTLSLTGCSVSGNSVGYHYWGGGLANAGGTVVLSNCDVNGNDGRSYGFGGGVANLKNGMITLTGCTISDNRGRAGGGLINYQGQMSLTDCVVSSNTGGAFDGGDAGGLDTSGTLNLTNCLVSDNTVVGGTGSGGGLAGNGTINLTNCSFTGNSAGGNGGGLSASHGTATLSGCTFGGNKARDSGGGNWGYGGGLQIGSGLTASLTNCTITGNSAVNRGGGLYIYGSTVNLTDCTLSDNAAQYGGGLREGGSGSATLIDCTISGNSATNGGGLRNVSTMNLIACTVSGNSAPNGGGLNNSGTAVLTDTIVAGNTVPNTSTASDIQGTVASTSSYNLIGPGGWGGLLNGVGGNIILADPSTLLLAPLGYYGGPTQTMALLPGSPAIGEGTAVMGVTTDQRGEPLDTPNPDIGAFQAGSGLVVNATSDGTASASGDLNLRQAVDLANLQDEAETISFDATVFAMAQTITLTQGPLELSDTGGTMTITGTTAGLTLSGGGASCVFEVDAGVNASISGLTITGGSAITGGGLYNQGTTTLTDCTISGNSAEDSGGGLGGDGATTLYNCTISGNSATDGGGLVIGGTASLTDCTVSGNYADANGGGLYNKGTATLQDTIVAQNTGNGGSPSDIEGSVSSSSSYNLIGMGGAGGLTNGTGHNIVLTSLAGLGLAPLGEYGGPSETMALLPRQRRNRRGHGCRQCQQRPARSVPICVRRCRYRRVPKRRLQLGRFFGDRPGHTHQSGVQFAVVGPIQREFCERASSRRDD